MVLQQALGQGPNRYPRKTESGPQNRRPVSLSLNHIHYESQEGGLIVAIVVRVVQHLSLLQSFSTPPQMTW